MDHPPHYMTAFFDFMPSLLPVNDSFHESQYATTVLRLTSEHRVYLDGVQHIYRLPPSTSHIHWTHYKVVLHGSAGHQQRIPFLVITGRSDDSTERILQKKEAPSMEWMPLPLFTHPWIHLHIGIPSTVCSEHCTLTILLRGVSADASSPKPLNLSR